MLGPADLFEHRAQEPATLAEVQTMSLGDYLQRCARHYILDVLDQRGWQINRTAIALGISRKNPWERMRRLGIASEQTPDA